MRTEVGCYLLGCVDFCILPRKLSCHTTEQARQPPKAVGSKPSTLRSTVMREELCLNLGDGV